MLVILGLIILVAALIVGVGGVLGNGGNTHPLGHGFSVLGFHVTGSASTVFLAGIVVGAAGMLGLGLLLAGARRTSRRGIAARRSLRQSQRETAAVSKDRDDLIDQRDTARANTAIAPAEGASQGRELPDADDGSRSGFQLFGRRFAARQTTAAQPDPLIGDPCPAEADEADAPVRSSVLAPAGASTSDIPADQSASAQ